MNNMLKSLNESQTGRFQWLNQAPVRKSDSETLLIDAPARTDFFIDPTGKHIRDNAPYLYTDITGDFRLQAQVAHNFSSVWDAAALMVWNSPDKWAKLCYEATDFGTRAIVSVVTDGVSDDANGVNYHWSSVWLQIVRQGNVFAFHYGPDGHNWNMVRLFRLQTEETIRVGIVAQCPAGNGSTIQFNCLSIDDLPVKDLRAGV